MKDNPFQVLRVVPVNRFDDEEDHVFAKVDLIHRDYKLLLFDCELYFDHDFGQTDVTWPDPAALLRYHLEPDFCGELDFATTVDQVNAAACNFFGLPQHEGPERVLYRFYTSGAWARWAAAHPDVGTRECPQSSITFRHVMGRECPRSRIM
jgi:hypothetical protein